MNKSMRNVILKITTGAVLPVSLFWSVRWSFGYDFPIYRGIDTGNFVLASLVFIFLGVSLGCLFSINDFDTIGKLNKLDTSRKTYPPVKR